MGCVRNILNLGLAAGLLVAGFGASASPEPLVVTRLPDPDPNYVPPPLEPAGTVRRDDADQNASIDRAMEDFGRAVGQAGLVIRQKLESKCRESIPADVPAEQRYAWEARCSYQRY
jgi:hypothetical protein